MNPVLVFLIILSTVVLWFLLSGVFKLIGKITNTIYNDTIDVMFEKEEGEKSV